MSHETSSEHASAHHDFDGEPATELPADEPRTPGWVPALGLALFVVVGGVLLVRGAGEPQPAPAPTAAPVTAAQAAQPVPAQPPPPTQGTAAPRPSGARPQLTPEAARDLQKRIDEARKRRAEAGAASAPAAPAAPKH